jgi:hypothetical protein
MAYSYKQLMEIWVNAGGSKAYAPIAAAVAMAESGGNPNATNKNTNGTVDRGLWQINSIHGSRSTTDPSANAKAAVAISEGGTNWKAWVAYTTGRYRTYLQQTVSARKSGKGPSTARNTGAGVVPGTTTEGTLGEDLGGVWDTATAVPRFLGNLSKASTWLRVGEGILGVICVIGGGVLIAQVLVEKSGAGKLAGQVIGVVGPGGKVSKAASAVSSIGTKGES